MGRYRARDLWLLPNLISLTRLPLAALFPVVLARDAPGAALAVLFAAGASDVLDGYVARRYALATATGAALDGVTDKLFTISVMLALLAEGALPPIGILALSAREIGELPLVVWWALSARKRREKAEQPRANVPGKLATCLQFASVAAALLQPGWLAGLLVASALAGTLAAVTYWRRELAS